LAASLGGVGQQVVGGPAGPGTRLVGRDGQRGEQIVAIAGQGRLLHARLRVGECGQNQPVLLGAGL
jgi:hypothetical protein